MNRERHIQLVIFDFDGTLIDAYQAVAESVNDTLKAFGYTPVSDEKIKHSVGWGEIHLLKQFVRKKDLAKALRRYRRHHPGSLRRGTKFLPGAKAVLRDLKKQGYKIAIASNRATQFTRLIVRHLCAQKYFDYILCRDRVRRPKPSPDILKGILRKFSLSPEEAIFVGDMVVDIQAGHRAKVNPIAVVTGSCTQKELAAAKPFQIIQKISDVKGVLRQLNSLK